MSGGILAAVGTAGNLAGLPRGNAFAAGHAGLPETVAFLTFAGTPRCRDAGAPGRRDAGTPGRRDAGIRRDPKVTPGTPSPAELRDNHTACAPWCSEFPARR